MLPTTVIRIDGLSQSFKDGRRGVRTIYDNLRIEIPHGELFVILGRNGVGKSTLLRSIAGLLRPDKGTINILGRDLDGISKRELASLTSYVSTEMLKITNLTVHDMVGMGRSPYTNWIGRLSAEDEEAVMRSIGLVGMASFADKDITTLSDGERQRIMIARALAQDTNIILLDEPTAFLDIPYKYEIASLLRELSHKEGKTIIFTTHDLNIALRLADTVCIISDGIASYGAPEDMVLNGTINSMLRGSPLEYNLEESKIILGTETIGTIRLESPPELNKLLTNALGRVGYAVDADAENKLIIRCEGSDIGLELLSGLNNTKFRNIGELLRYLRNNP
ncbi:MAG: ABC transporter ATP-binding protein [Rikenellaceae bacterium]|nr:ABC transporter ATP-binding protein [Rikenellaceae bacterium]